MRGVVNEVSDELGTVEPTEQPNAPAADTGADAVVGPVGGQEADVAPENPNLQNG